MPKLLDQVRITLRTRHYSIHTEQVYVSWIRDFILFHEKRHPSPCRCLDPKLGSFGRTFPLPRRARYLARPC
jgi:hypothetical protein